MILAIVTGICGPKDGSQALSEEKWWKDIRLELGYNPADKSVQTELYKHSHDA